MQKEICLTETVRRLRIFLIKPSKYDDDGHVIRYFRGVLPSNTLSCLDALTEEVVNQGRLGHVRVDVARLDDMVHQIRPEVIARKCRKKGVKGIVCLAGVQTNQFPRAADLAHQFLELGLDVLVGGFHVSGSIALSEIMPPEIQEVMDAGVTVVAGEIEEHWGDILEDAVQSRLKRYYNYLDSLPDLEQAPIPTISRKYLRRFAFPNFGTIDCSRGCPFHCSFCTIINVQGRKMRCRAPRCIVEAIRKNYRENRISFYFFTDDNFARNKNWEDIFDELIKLRKDEGIDVTFMMQVDVLSYRIEGFVEKAKRAGCTQVFIGMESLNPQNIEAVGKRHNRVDDYRYLISAWHDAGILTHVGYIIGFPFDTVESVREDMARLRNEVKPDIASFFMLTPLPGSMDYVEMIRSGGQPDSDYNNYDSFHEAFEHEHLKDGTWTETYFSAWDSFYSFENMKAILARTSPEHYWDVFVKLAVYKSAVTIDKQHPMVGGLFRLKDRRSRRPGFALESRWQHLKRRGREIFADVPKWFRFILDMEELWLQTRKPGKKEQQFFEEARRLSTEFESWRRLRANDFREICRRTHARMPSPFSRMKARLNLYSSRLTYTRRNLQESWASTRDQWKNHRFFKIRPFRSSWNFLCEMHYLSHFGLAVTGALLRLLHLTRFTGVS